MTDLQALTELCQELRNWFPRGMYSGRIQISDGEITLEDGSAPDLLPGQYYRLSGSVFSDGVHKYGADDLSLADESFDGDLCAMAIPAPVLALAEDIRAWRDTYEATDSQAMSPFTSESFGGYSYSKSAGGAGDGNGGGTGWKATFRARMNAWRKIL